MKTNKKLKLNTIQLKSFVTEMEQNEKQTILGKEDLYEDAMLNNSASPRKACFWIKWFKTAGNKPKPINTRAHLDELTNIEIPFTGDIRNTICKDIREQSVGWEPGKCAFSKLICA